MTVGAALKDFIEKRGAAEASVIRPAALFGKTLTGVRFDAVIIYAPHDDEKYIDMIVQAKKRLCPNILVISEPEVGGVSAMAMAGAKGIARGDSDPETLEEMIMKVVAGGLAFSNADLNLICEARIDGKTQKPALSKRETEVLACLASGVSARDAAKKLGITISTVETHRVRIYKKLNLNNVADLTRYAIKEKIIKN